MRRAIAHELTDQPFDLLVVGAGINGAGIARDAALRGLRVLLVDKGDIGGGTTSWSTRLIHGGLRYLEHYEVSLVRESLREREKLLRIAPHLVKPLGFLLPVYGSDERGLPLIRLGMVAYDVLSFDKSLPHHRALSRAKAMAQEPGLAPEGLKGAAFYYDGQVEFPERLAVENALSAFDAGAHVLTYHNVDGFLLEGGRVTGIQLRDQRTGATTIARGALTVNVAGPWVDGVLGSTAGLPEKKLIGGTKGSHIVVEPFPGAPKTALYVSAADGRPYFIVPWNELYLIGTTDTRYEGDLDHVEATEEEIAYLVGETNRVIPSAGLTRGDVLYTYAGVRPLPEAEGPEGAVTRRHIVKDHAPDVEGLLSIVGGKLTTYRELSRHTVDAALKKLGRKARKCRTADIGLPGGGVANFSAYAREFTAAAGLPEDVSRRLLRHYGTRAEDVLALTRAEPALAEVVDPATGALAAEVVHALQSELATSLQDVMLRRTMIAMGPHAGIGPDEAVARVAATHGGWDEARAESELAAFRDRMRIFHPRGLDSAATA